MDLETKLKEPALLKSARTGGAGRVYPDGIVNRKISALAGREPLSGEKPDFLKVVENRMQKTS